MIWIKILSRNIYWSFLFCPYPQLLVRTWLPGKPETVVINSLLRAQFVPLCQSCSRLRLEQLLRFSRGFQTSHAKHELIIYLSDRLSSCFACYRNYLLIDWPITFPVNINASVFCEFLTDHISVTKFNLGQKATASIPWCTFDVLSAGQITKEVKDELHHYSTGLFLENVTPHVINLL